MKRFLLMFAASLMLTLCHAQSAKIIDLPTLTSPSGSFLFGTKSGISYKVPTDSIRGTTQMRQLKGFALSVQSITDRNNISSLLRDTGMLVLVRSDSSVYTLAGGTTNSNWLKIVAPAARCLNTFPDITGNATDNSSIAAALAAKQNIITQQSILDTKPYFIDGHLGLVNFGDAVRGAFNATYDSTKSFTFFSDFSNAMLNKGAIPNTDSAFQIGGVYRYSNATRGTKPTNGSGMLINLVAQDLKYTTGAGRVFQIFCDYNLNRLAVRNALDATYGAYDTLATLADVRAGGGGGGGTYFPLTGGPLAATGYVGFPRRTSNPTTPTDSTINLYSNTSGYLVYQSKWGQFWNNFTRFSTNRMITWDDVGGTPIIKHVTTGVIQNATTDSLTEGSTNLYYTNARARAAISVTTSGTGAATYNNTTGVINIPTPSTGSVIGETWRSGITSGTLTTGQTQYAAPWSQAGLGGTYVSKAQGINEPGTLSNARVFTTGTQDASGAVTITLYKNGSATSIVITVPAGSSATSYTDATHTVTVAAGDMFAWRLDNAATATSLTFINFSITFKQ